MKKLLGIAAVVLFFLVLLVLLAVKLLPSSSSSPQSPTEQDPFKNISAAKASVVTDTPYRTAISCYKWYLGVYLTPSTLDQRAALPQSSECFTSSFLSQWNVIRSTSEADPVLTVMDYFPTWSSAISARTVGQSIRSNDQEITLGTGEEQFVIIAHLVLQPDKTWKIDSVFKPRS